MSTILSLSMLNHFLTSFGRFVLIQRQTHEYFEGLNFDEIGKSRSVTWTVLFQHMVERQLPKLFHNLSDGFNYSCKNYIK